MKNKDIIQQKLTQRPMESKKCIYAIFGSLCVLIVFTGSAFLILTHAEAAKEIVELANLVVMFFAAITTTILTGQAVVDFKGMSVLQHLDETQSVQSSRDNSLDVHSNQPIQSLNVDSPSLSETFVSDRRSPKDFISRDVAF